jgi:mannose-6-phosphate isomerase-like protein (cupin superfamily)
MKTYRIENSIGGWYVGNFPNAAYQTKGLEVSFKIHKQGENWDWHYHEHLDEINLLIRGTMIIQGKKLIPGDIFILEPLEIADPDFLEDCEIVCVKVPNFTNDKVVVRRDRESR